MNIFLFRKWCCVWPIAWLNRLMNVCSLHLYTACWFRASSLRWSEPFAVDLLPCIIMISEIRKRTFPWEERPVSLPIQQQSCEIPVQINTRVNRAWCRICIFYPDLSKCRIYLYSVMDFLLIRPVIKQAKCKPLLI